MKKELVIKIIICLLLIVSLGLNIYMLYFKEEIKCVDNVCEKCEEESNNNINTDEKSLHDEDAKYDVNLLSYYYGQSTDENGFIDYLQLWLYDDGTFYFRKSHEVEYGELGTYMIEKNILILKTYITHGSGSGLLLNNKNKTTKYIIKNDELYNYYTNKKELKRSNEKDVAYKMFEEIYRYMNLGKDLWLSAHDSGIYIDVY